MINFVNGISGEPICLLENFEKYKYFYHVKAYVLDINKYCYCTLMYDDKIIKDFEQTSDYSGELINVIMTNVSNYKLLDWIDPNKLT